MKRRLSLAPASISKTWSNFTISTLRPRQNGRRFADDTFRCTFLNENVRILIKISLKFVSKGPIKNIPALVQIMAWRRSGDKPLSEPMMVSLLTHICVTLPQWVNIITFDTLNPRIGVRSFFNSSVIFRDQNEKGWCFHFLLITVNSINARLSLLFITSVYPISRMQKASAYAEHRNMWWRHGKCGFYHL